MAVGEERPAVALLPALRMPHSSADGAAQGLHGVVQRLEGATPDGYQPGQQPYVQAAAQDSARALNKPFHFFLSL